MDVLKFGGTSLGTPDNFKRVAEIILSDNPKIVVLSAFSGTTNLLYDVVNELKAYRLQEAGLLIELLNTRYQNTISDLFGSGKYSAKPALFLKAFMTGLEKLCVPDPGHEQAKTIITKGEYLSTKLFELYLDYLGASSVLLDAFDFIRTDKEGEPDMLYIRENLQRMLAKYPGERLFITQGFVCKNFYGTMDTLGRGGSDYTASILGAAINAGEIQIWTDTTGMHTIDPELVKGTRTISELSYKEAAELSYFGARILHPKSVFPAQKYTIPLRIKNTMKPDGEGTLISSNSTNDRIKSVATKDGIIVLRIRSGRMLMAYGFLRKVFQVFEDYKTPIDIISTSEVSVSLTIDDAANLEAILEALKTFGEVDYALDQSIICVVGDFMAEETGMASAILKALEKVPVRMISYGGSLNNISLVVKTADKQRAIDNLHKRLFAVSKKHATTEI